MLAAASGDFTRVRRYLESGAGSETLGRTPIIAIPTTAGTGSEVTSWATVWDTGAMKKYQPSAPLAGDTTFTFGAFITTARILHGVKGDLNTDSIAAAFKAFVEKPVTALV